MKIDWKRKLSSRKFWAAVIGFATPVMVALNISNLTMQQVTAIITGAGTLIAYILSEGFVDASRTNNELKEGSEDKKSD